MPIQSMGASPILSGAASGPSNQRSEMIKNIYRLQLASPAFLGDADQRGAWRTPPLKALIREWWRIAVAPELGYDVSALKAREKDLFGTAADDSREGNQQSRIRLALSDWREGTCKQWEAGEQRVTHSEVKDRNTGKARPVGAELYLGYGPLVFQQGTQLKNGAALQSKDSNTLKLAFPETHADELARTLSLAHWFGTVGGRSRNGWGSLCWQALENSPALPTLSKAALQQTGCVRPLPRCLELDWPHALGNDAKGVLVWQSTQTFPSWRDAMKFLAQTKIGFRVGLGFVGGQPHREPQARHVLAYPVTNHKVPAWEGKDKGRLANTLRFKLHAEADGTLRALIYHTPCKPTLPHHGINLLDTWQQVHRHLDATPQLTRLA